SRCHHAPRRVTDQRRGVGVRVGGCFAFSAAWFARSAASFAFPADWRAALAFAGGVGTVVGAAVRVGSSGGVGRVVGVDVGRVVWFAPATAATVAVGGSIRGSTLARGVSARLGSASFARSSATTESRAVIAAA